MMIKEDEINIKSKYNYIIMGNEYKFRVFRCFCNE